MNNKERGPEENIAQPSATQKECQSKQFMVDLIDNSHENIERDAHAFKPAQYNPQPEKSSSSSEEEETEPKKEVIVDKKDNVDIQERFNTKALPQHAKTYQLERFKKNAMIIFNHEYVDGYSKRKGTMEDERVLRETFSKFGFEIEPPQKDLSKVELFSELKKFSEKDFTDFGCVVIVILTHGARNGLLRAKDEGQLYSEQDVMNQFKARNKPTLFTKPVILIIQACRGTASTQGVAVMQRITISKDHDEEIKPYFLPVESDMLIMHSSFAGKPSYRPDNGSWFIQTLCKQVNALYRTHDIESIFTEVKREVAVEKYYMEHNPATNQMDVNKQMPVVTSTLIRKLYLRRFNDTPPLILPLTAKRTDYNTSTDSVPDQCDQMDSCCCFLDHFGYMKKCLSYVVETNPRDNIAKGLLEIANFESGVNNEKTKATLIAISNYLQKHYKNVDSYKYIYFYESGFEVDDIECNENENKSTLQTVTRKWNEWSHNHIIRSLGTCVGAILVYSFVKRL